MALSKAQSLRGGFTSNCTHTDAPVFCLNMQASGTNKQDYVTYGPDVYIGEITGFGFSAGNYYNSSTIYSFEELFNAMDEMLKNLNERISKL